MMRPEDLQRLGEADLELGGLKIWVHGRQFPESSDYWDGNWLRITAFCRYPGAWVSTEGTIIHLGEVAGFLDGLLRLHKTLEGTACLDCIEPELKVQLQGDGKGHVDLTIHITPDQLVQRHRFTDTIDQTFLPGIVASCQSILSKYPIRGSASPTSGV
jgi:hypothetical protein